MSSLGVRIRNFRQWRQQPGIRVVLRSERRGKVQCGEETRDIAPIWTEMVTESPATPKPSL